MKKNQRNKFFVIVMGLMLLVGFSAFEKVHAQSANSQSVDYKGQPVIDSDLDGLTDEGEVQIYHTDPKNADTDGDGYADGAEVLAGSDPLDASSTPGSAGKVRAQNIVNAVFSQTPWTQYVLKSSVFIVLALMCISISLFLAARITFLKKYFFSETENSNNQPEKFL